MTSVPQTFIKQNKQINDKCMQIMHTIYCMQKQNVYDNFVSFVHKCDSLDKNGIKT